MRVFAFLPVVFCIGVQSLPAALPGAAAVAAPGPEALPAANASSLRAPCPLEKRASIIKTIEGVLDSLGLTPTSTVSQLLHKLGLSTVEDDVDELLSGLVGGADGALNKVNEIVDGLLVDLGLGGLGTTIADVEKALGISGHDTIRKLLKSLHLL